MNLVKFLKCIGGVFKYCEFEVDLLGIVMLKLNYVVVLGSVIIWNGCLNRIIWICKGIYIIVRRRIEVGLDFFFF